MQHLCTDSGYSPEDLLEAVNNRDDIWCESGKSMLAAWQDDDDDLSIYLSIYLFYFSVLYLYYNSSSVKKNPDEIICK